MKVASSLISFILLIVFHSISIAQEPNYNPVNELLTGNIIEFRCEHNSAKLMGSVVYSPKERKYVVRVAPAVKNDAQPIVKFIGEGIPTGGYTYLIQMPLNESTDFELIEMEVYQDGIDYQMPNTTGNPRGKGTLIATRANHGDSFEPDEKHEDSEESKPYSKPPKKAKKKRIWGKKIKQMDIQG